MKQEVIQHTTLLVHHLLKYLVLTGTRLLVVEAEVLVGMQLKLMERCGDGEKMIRVN